MRTSYSSLNTYKTCPLKFKHETIDKIPAPKSKEAFVGGLVHKALHFMFTKSPLFPTLDEVINFFHKLWNQKKEKDSWEEEEELIYQKEGIDILKKFYKSNPPWNFHVVDLESRFEVLIEDPRENEPHILAGIIDRVDKLNDGSYEIIDYKTAKRMPSQDIVDNDLQMSIYNLGILKRWPHLINQKIKLTLHFLKHDEKISTYRSPESLNKTKQEIIKSIYEIKERLRNNDFPPTPSALCDWCGYRKICPAWRHLYPDQWPSLNSEEIKNVIKEYFELKEKSQTAGARIKELQAIINNFMEKEKIQRVFGEDGYISKNIRTAVSYDLEKAKAILQSLGKWDEILKIDERKLEKVVANLSPDFQEKFKNIIREQKTSSTLTTVRKKIQP